ncbi:MAG: hypothetical protein BZ137_01475 [Methanosphaera sp. rholeuAM130]|nr:MAG: hypothetical protein BZ137_01475 [Methanosphaera sp. rholeuAM130]
MNDSKNNQGDNSQNNNGYNPNQQMNNNNINNNPQNNFNPQNNDMDENSIITGLFYKKDKYTNQYRLAKTKTISIALFFFMLLFSLWATYDTFGYLEAWDFIGAIILALVVTIPVFVIGFIVGKLMEDNNNPYQQIPNPQYNPQVPNGQYNPQMQNGQVPNGPYNQQIQNQPLDYAPNQQVPNQQFNQQMPDQQVPNQQINQPDQQVPYNEVPNQDFTRVANEQVQNADNQQNFYNPPDEINREDTQDIADVEDTNMDNPTMDDSSTIEKNDVEDSNAEIATNENTINNEYYDRDNLGTNHDTVEKATAYWLGERFQSEYKPPFTMYVFDNPNDAEEALLELPYIHKAADTGNLICDEVFIYGYYKVSEDNYEAIVCGKDLTYEQFTQAEEAFEKHGGTRKNNLEPDKTVVTKPKDDTPNNGQSSVKFREKINKDQFTYECYDADNKNDALEFLKTKDVNQRLYYICVYTPEGDYGKDIDGVYQM